MPLHVYDGGTFIGPIRRLFTRRFLASIPPASASAYSRRSAPRRARCQRRSSRQHPHQQQTRASRGRAGL